MVSKLYTKSLLGILILFALMVSAFGIKAQKTRELTQEDDKKTSQKRVALVIGNGAYTKAKPLANPSNDAADMAQALKNLGFEVISGVNQNKRQMETLIREFGTKLSASGGVGLFYYAGHGLQVGGENYLVPVDADIPEEDEVAYSAVSINLVLSKMQTAKNDLNIIILDACRNNPFARSWRSFRDNSSSDGLAKISPPTGTLVLYATEPGKVASDGSGRNGLFTEALLKQIKQPNLEYDQMVKALSADVWQKSNKQQLPWKEGNSLQDFYFATKLSEPNIVVKDRATQEKEAWDLVKYSSDAEDFRLFLKEFPDGANSGKAKIQLEELIWSFAKNSKDKTKIQEFLNEFPNSSNAAAARILLRQLESNPNLSVSENNGINSEDILQVGSLLDFAIKKVNPEYPPIARTLKQTGVVRLEVIVDEQGYVAQITSITGPALLQTAAKDAVKKWTFSPFIRDGKPIKASGFLSFNFNL